MEIYTDKAEQKAILICNAGELSQLKASFFFGAEHFRILAEKEPDFRETNYNVAMELAEMHDKVAQHLMYDLKDDDFIKII